MHRVTLCTAVTLTLTLLGCDPLADPTYRGEVMTTFRGVVTSQLTVVPPPAEVAVVWSVWDSEKEANSYHEATSVPVQGSFPATFEVSLFHPPPTSARNDAGAMVEQFASFYPDVSAAGPDFAFGFLLAVRAGAPSAVAALESADLLGVSDAHFVLWLAEGTDEDSVMARLFGRGLSAGYHVVTLITVDEWMAIMAPWDACYLAESDACQASCEAPAQETDCLVGCGLLDEIGARVSEACGPLPEVSGLVLAEDVGREAEIRLIHEPALEPLWHILRPGESQLPLDPTAVGNNGGRLLGDPLGTGEHDVAQLARALVVEDHSVGGSRAVSATVVRPSAQFSGYNRVIVAVENSGAAVECFLFGRSLIYSDEAGVVLDTDDLALVLGSVASFPGGATSNCLRPGERGYLMAFPEVEFGAVHTLALEVAPLIDSAVGDPQGRVEPTSYAVINRAPLVSVENVGAQAVSLGTAAAIYLHEGEPIWFTYLDASAATLEPGEVGQLSSSDGSWRGSAVEIDVRVDFRDAP